MLQLEWMLELRSLTFVHNEVDCRVGVGGEMLAPSAEKTDHRNEVLKVTTYGGSKLSVG
jgi:hypothetical protein